MLGFCIRDSYYETLWYINCQKFPGYKCKCFQNGVDKIKCNYKSIVTVQFNLPESTLNHILLE